MRKEGAERRTELLRKLVHVGSGFIALALAWLTWQQALMLAVGALAFNALILPRIGGKALHREDDLRRGHAFGILMYPLSVIVLIVAFRERLEFVAIGWALMAFGDGMASVVGSMMGRHHLPWNPRKSWEGVAAHVVFGAGFAAAIGSFVLDGGGFYWWSNLPVLLPWVAAAALVTAVVESIDSGIDDNLLVPLLGGGVAFVAPYLLPGLIDPASAHRALFAAGLCAVLAVASWALGKLTAIGSIGAATLGVIVAGGGGWGLFAALCAFFAIGVGVTRIGRGVKEARGIAESRGGRRGLGNVLANGGMAGMLAILATRGVDVGWPFVLDGVHRDLDVILVGVAALATSAFDTCSSEIGKAFGRRTFLPTTLRAVPPGTEGAISMEGTLAGVVGAMLVALTAWFVSPWVFTWRVQVHVTPGPVVLVALVVVAAFIGSMFESIVGALCHERGHHVQNDFMNFANTVVGAAAMAIMLSCI